MGVGACTKTVLESRLMWRWKTTSTSGRACAKVEKQGWEE